jgi:hypothetical protein
MVCAESVYSWSFYNVFHEVAAGISDTLKATSEVIPCLSFQGFSVVSTCRFFHVSIGNLMLGF